MEVSAERREEIVTALEHWAETHPFPEQPTIVWGDAEMTPADIVAEVRKESFFGKHLVEFIHAGCERLGKNPAEVIRFKRED